MEKLLDNLYSGAAAASTAGVGGRRATGSRGRLAAPEVMTPTASTGRRRRVGLINLGCPKNRVDSEVMLGELVAAGYELTPDLEAAETVIVNTCGFIDEAKQESIDTILEVAAKKADGVVRELLVAGCMVQQYGQELRAEIPEIDGFLSLDDLRRADELVGLGGAPAPPRARSHALFDHTAPRRLTTRGYAYLKVAEGCNNPCTFCAIPLWRGRFRSRTIESLVEEARQLEADRRPGALPDRPGHHALRRGPRARPPRPAAAGGGAARRAPTSPGSASSTPIRRRSTTSCCG